MDLNLANKRILVLGGTGFIGQHLVKRLLEKQARVSVLAHQNHQVYAHTMLEHFAQVDLSHIDTLKTALPHYSFDYVFNLAGYIDHAHFANGGRSVFDVHYNGLLNVLELIDRKALKRFIQVGSSDEYGNTKAPQSEGCREAPISPYSLAKVAATHLIQTLARIESFPGVVLRLFLVYGPGQQGARLLPQAIKACLNNTSFPTSLGEQLRDFCFVDDVIDAFLLAADSDAAIGEVINIASGLPVKVKNVIELIQSLIGSGMPQWGAMSYREGENMALYADIDKARRLLKWSPKTSLELGIKQTIDSYS